MLKFITRKNYFKRLLALLCMIGLLFYLVFIFNSRLGDVENFRPYHLQAYAFELKNLKTYDKTPENLQQNAISVPVLLYHGIIDKPDGSNVTLSNFIEQMKAMKEMGYQTVSLSDFNEFIKGEKQIPDKSFLITFDDGRRDSFYPVDPVLKTLGYRAVIFSIGKPIADNNVAHLSGNELKRLISTGRWEVGSHSYNSHDNQTINGSGETDHALSNYLWLPDKQRLENIAEYEARVANDLIYSKYYLQKITGRSIVGFAFPFNDYGQESKNNKKAQDIILQTAQNTFSLGFYQANPANGGTFNYPIRDSFMIKRINILPDWNKDKLIQTIKASEAKNFPYSNDYSKTGEWIMTRARFNVENTMMILGSNVDNTGSTAFLDGAAWWKNYTISANLNWVKGSNFFLLARYKDDSSYLSCNYSNERVRVEQRTNNETEVLTEAKGQFLQPGKDINVSMKVNNNEAVCLVNNIPVATNSGIDPSLKEGSIGFKTWDATAGNSEIEIKNVSSKEIK